MKEEERILLDPQKVFGAETTVGGSYFETNFGKERCWIFICPRWYECIEVSGFEDITGIPPICPPVGTVILALQEDGRIDRYEVIVPDKVRCYYKSTYQSDFIYADWEERCDQRGSINRRGDDGKICGLSATCSKIVRLLCRLAPATTES